ncbi:vacuole effluxer Atg22 like-domain-containing protein [Lineolata rhizophorae]|uniref:Autophagy-related protein n=1 Tax=Lineolata rhizophorae TaxID=578093 RepID=A0A6A6P6K4_9PEZI|nr:vacuole effluxer Atg22 like-domain-containing protein [Lineolata rhizophorae]
MAPRAPSPPPPPPPPQTTITTAAARGAPAAAAPSPLPRRPPLPDRTLSALSTVSKQSVPRSSRSDEADDERSLSDPSYPSSMGPGNDDEGPNYDDEDTRPTSRKELAGFYIYGWAAEVFVVCGIGSFIPVTLEELARERGVLMSDRTTPCSTNFHIPPSLNYTTVFDSPPGHTAPPSDSGQCVCYILGIEINTASFAMYTFSISVLIQALLIISMSGAADHGRYRKSLLLTFAFTGAVATMLFLPVVPKVFLFGALFAIIANTCFGASFVLLNSFLPLLVRHHPSIREVEDEEADDDEGGGTPSTAPTGAGGETPRLVVEDERGDVRAPTEEDEPLLDRIMDSTAALLPDSESDYTAPHPRSRATPSAELALSTRISSYGIGIGYIAAVLVQTLAIAIVLAQGSGLWSLRLVLFVIGAWWFVFSIPAALWLRPRPGPPLHLGATGTSTSASTTSARLWLAYLTYSWKSLGRSVRRARHLKDVLLFLGAWFLLSDGIATVSGTAVLFAKTSLDMRPAALALINVIATLSGVVGAFSWSRLSILMGLRPSHTVIACICLFEVIPIYGLLGYVPAVRRLGRFGLQEPWEMYPLGAVYGFVLGGLSSYCRSLFGELIPPGHEAAFYALYAITDKGSSVFGPAIVGAITDATGEIRPAFWFLAVLIGIPLPLMLLVDVERGRREGIAMARELDDSKGKSPQRRRPESYGSVDEPILRNSFESEELRRGRYG